MSSGDQWITYENVDTAVLKVFRNRKLSSGQSIVFFYLGSIR